MYANDLQVEKTKLATHSRIEARGQRFLDGPWLGLDGAVICIPSPRKHPDFVRVLRARGFEFIFSHSGSFWQRSTTTPLGGKTYSPEAWLAWARKRYGWAWPMWPGNDN